MTNNWAGARVGQRPGNLVFTWLIMPGTIRSHLHRKSISTSIPWISTVCSTRRWTGVFQLRPSPSSVEQRKIYLLPSMRGLFESKRIFFLSFRFESSAFRRRETVSIATGWNFSRDQSLQHFLLSQRKSILSKSMITDEQGWIQFVV